jgi:thiamine biosynthesis protein ThiI
MLFIVRYHEIALKGKNRPFFVERLAENLRRALSDLEGVSAQPREARVIVGVPDSADPALVRARLGSVFGVANFSPAYDVEPDLEALKTAAIERLQGRSFASFRVLTKRSFKGFPKTSMEIDREVGGAIKAASGAQVDLTHPELVLHVEVLRHRIFFSFEKLPGPGGFAVGSSGRVMALLSGGIDSPVAAYRLMKRGCRVLFAHFHAFPLQDHATIDKARELVKVLTRYQFKSQLLLVPFGVAQQTIVASCPAPLRVVLYRRFMIRIAEALAQRYHAKALVTGESLGQVASQTLDNMTVIDAAAQGAILRPLVGMDKDEITEQAQRLGSFEISIQPDQDCCQLFVPRSPATAAKLEDVLRAEEALDVEDLVGAAVRDTVEERFEFP